MKFLAPTLILSALLFSTPAFAHAFLTASTPAVGSTVTKPPATLLMTYTEGLEIPFCHVTVTNAAGVSVAKGKPHAVPGHADEMTLALNITSPGKYTVTWHAVSVDTHHTQGRFTFTVAR